MEAAFGVYVEVIGRRPQPMDKDFAAALATQSILVCEMAGEDRPCGCILFERLDDGNGFIDTVAVRPDAQGKGIGPALIAAAEDHVRRQGATMMTLYTNAKMARNLTLYPSLGYREVGRGWDRGYERVRYEKPLAPPIAVKRTVEGLHGRRRVHGHKADPTYDRFAIDPETPFDAAALFARPMSALRMEIGFGGGEHLLHHASIAPDIGLIGIEPFESGMMKAIRAIDREGADNVRLYMGDARRILEWLPQAALDRVDILYPDPWPKRKHWKRRFISIDGLDRLARAVRPGGTVRFASDIPSYVTWTRAHVAAHPDFDLERDSVDAYPDWPGTRYEAKAFREGRTPRYLVLARR
ncbi:GNAT family N-acetyltransferase [Acuticoccus sp. M5D2P5]|uniref:GNAT family N-acetyltransferase n=1 Tax=Acuticoccus kalidii TaxID=2910977 RepID=UPI001F2D99AA|nr:GNAT family N-acetyltransferase [Acuticoccus kalidii]